MFKTSWMMDVCFFSCEGCWVMSQSSSSVTSISSDGGFKGSSEYTRSQLEASAAQKDSFFSRKMQVRHFNRFKVLMQISCLIQTVQSSHLKLYEIGNRKVYPKKA